MKQKRALITGGSKGIGLAIAKSISSTGHAVAIISRDKEQSANALQKLSENDRAYNCDVSDSAAVKRTLSDIEETFGMPDLIINNAGYGGPYEEFADIDEAEWLKVINTNLTSIFHIAQWAVPAMKRSHDGHIINISSVFGLAGGDRSVAYSCVKHGIIGITKALAAELGPHGIMVNAVCPGFIETDMTASIDPMTREAICNRTPAKRFGKAEEVANLVSFMIGVQSHYLTGSVITLDGGLSSNIGV